ncbi:16S rRNA (cytosine(1402)-N(4))-methyltransferase RsmH [bacterium]|nr:16S rRNA (cytosine(1402)-N(4))-methyltransferase RsmH [bacterium]
MNFQHTPVLFNEIISFLPKSAKVIIDFTLGGAGHSIAMLQHCGDSVLYGVDRDNEAITSASQNLSGYTDRIHLLHCSFSEAINTLKQDAVSADFILADLGVSSHQLDSGKRGFSFRQDGPLDMRMNPDDPTTAADIVNNASQEELTMIIKKYGEDRFAKKIAQNIVRYRRSKQFSTTLELSECIKDAVPKKFHFDRIHPATRTFQAIRMEVNRELEELNYLLEHSIDLLNTSGKMAVISFHSLEDRPVKQMFRKWEDPCQCPKSIPRCICGLKPIAKRVNRKMIMASDQEKAENFRSRSAKLRVMEKL